MTAVILAPSYAHAYDAAQILGIGPSWVYPHDPVLLNGLQVTRVVYVKGWTHSDIPVESMQMLAARTTEATLTTTLDVDAPPGRPVALSAPESATQPSGPQAVAERPRRGRRALPTWVALPVFATLGGILGSVGYRLGVLWGWW